MKVYFNNSCKICKAEIDLYKKEKVNQISWIDITDNQNAQKETKKDDRELLRRLHVETDGKIFSGAKAFLLVWKVFQNIKFYILFLVYHLFFKFFQ